MAWCFRIRGDLRPTSKLEFTDEAWIIDQPDSAAEIKLKAVGASTLAEARSIALLGSGYASEEAATAAGERWRAILMGAFASIRVGADFGGRSARSGFATAAGMAMVLPPGERGLNDVHGLMVFECDPPPKFLLLPPVTPMVSSPHERLQSAVTHAIKTGGLNESHQVAYDLFQTSFGQASADARFALLMMALEALIEPKPRSTLTRRHVELLIEQTRDSHLEPSEIQSIVGSLSYLLDESIGQAGRRLAQKLAPTTYKGMLPAKFFTEAYTLRSRLVHGLHPIPSRAEINAFAAPLEVFVADLLTLAG